TAAAGSRCIMINSKTDTGFVGKTVISACPECSVIYPVAPVNTLPEKTVELLKTKSSRQCIAGIRSIPQDTCVSKQVKFLCPVIQRDIQRSPPKIIGGTRDKAPAYCSGSGAISTECSIFF